MPITEGILLENIKEKLGLPAPEDMPNDGILNFRFRVQMAGWFNKEINSLKDIKGMKMRIPGLGGEVFERAGGTAVNLALPEIFTSLQTGVIDATEWVGPYNDLTIGLHQVAKYYYYPGWQEPGPTLEFIINKNAFSELPEDLKEIVTVAAKAVNVELLAEYTARNNAALRELVDVHKVELRRLPDDVLQELQIISEEMIAEIAGDEVAKAAIDILLALEAAAGIPRAKEQVR